jgi:hypothetical protein
VRAAVGKECPTTNFHSRSPWAARSHFSLTRPLGSPAARTHYSCQLYRYYIPRTRNTNPTRSTRATVVCMSIENLKTFDPFAEADEGTGEKSSAQSQDYIHIRIQRTYSRAPPCIWSCVAMSLPPHNQPPKILRPSIRGTVLSLLVVHRARADTTQSAMDARP